MSCSPSAWFACLFMTQYSCIRVVCGSTLMSEAICMQYVLLAWLWCAFLLWWRDSCLKELRRYNAACASLGLGCQWRGSVATLHNTQWGHWVSKVHLSREHFAQGKRAIKMLASFCTETGLFGQNFWYLFWMFNDISFNFVGTASVLLWDEKAWKDQEEQ